MQFEDNASLLSHNTFHIDCTAKSLVTVRSLEEFTEVMRSPLYDPGSSLILGGGSNILFPDRYPGLVIRNRIKGFRVLSEDEDSAIVRAYSGETWHSVVSVSVLQGWGGLENLALIPGTVGAAPIQNIGAYGVELKDVLVSLEAVDLATGEIRSFSRSECDFGYRDSIFKNRLKGKYFIYSIDLRLSENPVVNTSYGAINEVLQAKGISEPGIKDVYEAVIGIRQSKLPDPAVIGNAGSFFKNPELSIENAQRIFDNYPEAPRYVVDENTIKVPAGWMIEKCGWKGFRDGDIGVHDKQALVLVNHGKGKGSDIRDLSENIRKSVHEKFGVWLQTEVNIIG